MNFYKLHSFDMVRIAALLLSIQHASYTNYDIHRRVDACERACVSVNVNYMRRKHIFVRESAGSTKQ